MVRTMRKEQGGGGFVGLHEYSAVQYSAVQSVDAGLDSGETAV